MTKYSSKNAEAVLEQVEQVLAEMEKSGMRKIRIRSVCDRLSIFDWWNDTMSTAQLKDMGKFLRNAIKRGYTGYVCFKVGAAGCSNGMWAHKNESENGYSPAGEFLYKSFVSTYNYWSVKAADGEIYPKGEYDAFDGCKTIKQLDELLAEINR